MAKGDFMLQQLLKITAATGALPEPASRTRLPDYDFAATVASIAERHAKGETLSSIAACLNKQGLRARNGGRLYPATIRSYLLRRCAAGLPSA